MPEPVLLDSREMASFVARGFLRFDAVVPEAINSAFPQSLGTADPDDAASMRAHYGRIMAATAIPTVNAGIPPAQAYPAGSPLQALLDLSVVRGAIERLVGSHLRIVSAAAIARYRNVRGQQHVVCPAGTLLVLQHGIWHGAGGNEDSTGAILTRLETEPAGADPQR